MLLEGICQKCTYLLVHSVPLADFSSYMSYEFTVFLFDWQFRRRSALWFIYPAHFKQPYHISLQQKTSPVGASLRDVLHKHPVSLMAHDPEKSTQRRPAKSSNYVAFIRMRGRVKLRMGAYHCPTSFLPPEFLFVKGHDLDLKWSICSYLSAVCIMK